MSVDHYFDGLMVMGPRSLGSGKSAYDYAVEGGYTGTETEFALRMAFLMNGTVVGYMEGSTVVLSGSLSPGTYTFAYALRKTDGTTETAVIGTYTVEEEPEAPTYTVTFVADGVTVDRVNYTEGDTELSRIPDVPVKDGYTGVWEEYTLNGNLTVNAVYTKIEVDPAEPTNFFDTNEDGYYSPGRLSSAGLNRDDTSTCLISNYIPVQTGDIVYVNGCNIAATLSGANTHYTSCYNSSKAHVSSAKNKTSNSDITFDTITSTGAQITVTGSAVRYLRFTCCQTTGGGQSLPDTSKIVINIKRGGAYL